MLSATVNQSVPLQILAADGRTDLYAQIRVYDSGGLLITTISAAHLAEGLYGNSWIPVIEGYYTMVGQLYFDAGHTVDAGYEHQGENIDVNSIKTNILRLLGLDNENVVLDSLVNDGDGNMTSARVRCYDSKPNAQAAGLTGLLFKYTINATYAAGLLTTYTMLRDL